jgi:hypothetical protein
MALPCDHLEKQPPHISALNGSCSGALMERTRDPESSSGTKSAPQAAHGSSRSDRARVAESVSVIMVILFPSRPGGSEPHGKEYYTVRFTRRRR